MIYLVTPENRHLFEKQLRQMWRQRYAVFVQMMGWNIPNKANEKGLEVDVYDTDDSHYLLALSDRGSVTASIRLNPTTGPYMMKDLFDDMCLGGAPEGDDVWEATRFYVRAPRATHEERIMLGIQIQAAMTEFSLLRGIDQVSFVISTNFLAMLSGLGITPKPLGLPVEMHGEPQVACVCDMTPATLESLRSVTEHKGSILCIEQPRQVA